MNGPKRARENLKDLEALRRQYELDSRIAHINEEVLSGDGKKLAS